MLSHIAAEVRHVGKSQLARNLLDAQVRIAQIEADILNGVLHNPVGSGLIAVFQAKHSQIFGCDGQLTGIMGDRLTLHLTVGDHLQEAVEQRFALRLLGIAAYNQ